MIKTETGTILSPVAQRSDVERRYWCVSGFKLGEFNNDQLFIIFVLIKFVSAREKPKLIRSYSAYVSVVGDDEGISIANHIPMPIQLAMFKQNGNSIWSQLAQTYCLISKNSQSYRMFTNDIIFLLHLFFA